MFFGFDSSSRPLPVMLVVLGRFVGLTDSQLGTTMNALAALLIVAALQPSAGFVGAGLWRPRGMSHRSSQSRGAAPPEADAPGDSWAPAGADEVPVDPDELQVDDT